MTSIESIVLIPVTSRIAMKTFVSLIVIAFCMTTPLSAQQMDPPDTRSKVEGLTIGVYLNGTALQVEDSEDVESGGGLSLRLGYGLNDNAMIYVAGTGAAVEHADFDDTYTLGHFDLGGRYLFGGSGSPARPFVEAALSGRAATIDDGYDSLDVGGAGATLGGGIEYFASRNLAFEAALEFMYGTFSQGRLNGGRGRISETAASPGPRPGSTWGSPGIPKEFIEAGSNPDAPVIGRSERRQHSRTREKPPEPIGRNLDRFRGASDRRCCVNRPGLMGGSVRESRSRT